MDARSRSSDKTRSSDSLPVPNGNIKSHSKKTPHVTLTTQGSIRLRQDRRIENRLANTPQTQASFTIASMRAIFDIAGVFHCFNYVLEFPV